MVKKMLYFIMLVLPLICIADIRYYQIFFIISSLIFVIITFSVITINMVTYKIVKTSFFDFLLIPMIFNFFTCLFRLYNEVNAVLNDRMLIMYQNMQALNKLILVCAFILGCRFIDVKLSIKKIYTSFSLIYAFLVLNFCFNPIAMFLYNNKSILNFFLIIMDLTALTIYLRKKKNADYNILKIMTWALLFLTLSEILIFFNNIYLLKLAELFKLYFYLLLYHGIFVNNLKEPIGFLFRELSTKNSEIMEKMRILEEDKKHIELLNKEALETSSMYEELIDNLPEAIILKKYHKIVFVNKEAEKMLKTRRDDLINKSILEIVHEDCLNDVKNRISKDYRKINIPVIEEKLIDSEGNAINVELCVMPIKFNNETYSISIIKNLNDRKNLAIRERQIRKLRENENLKDNFISNISHEFNTPVNVIYTAVQLLEGKSADDSYRKYLGIIKKNCERIIRLNNNLIDITKYEAGELKPHFKNENIYKIFENIVNDIRDYLKAKGINIRFASDSQDIWILCDKNLIERVALNIISNSIKFSRENGEIDIIIKKQRNGVRISISDNGIGISRANLKNIILKFNKEDLGLSRKNEGIGIGLSIVKAFIDIHGGKLLIRSKKDIGTIVSIFLPKNMGLQEAAADVCIVTESRDNKINIELSDIY